MFDVLAYLLRNENKHTKVGKIIGHHNIQREKSHHYLLVETNVETNCVTKHYFLNNLSDTLLKNDGKGDKEMVIEIFFVEIEYFLYFCGE